MMDGRLSLWRLVRSSSVNETVPLLADKCRRSRCHLLKLPEVHVPILVQIKFEESMVHDVKQIIEVQLDVVSDFRF